MASQSDQAQPKREACEASVDNHPPPGGQQPPGNGNPPMMGYPPPMGYPPGAIPPGYPHQVYPYPYPNNGHNNNNNNSYPCPQAPPAGYYNPHMYPSQQGYRPSNFARGMLLGLFFLVFLMCTSSFVVWLVLRPQVPKFHVDAFSVSNFSAAPPSLFTGNWDANVSIHNPNSKLKVEFSRIEAHVYYDNDNRLASSFALPFSLDTKATSTMPVRMSANGISQLEGDSGSLVDKLAKERNTGNVSFDLRMALWTTFKNSWWTRHATLRVFCKDMKVAFVGATGNGNLADGKLSDCIVVDY